MEKITPTALINQYTMGLGIYEPGPPRHVPGTATLYEDQSSGEAPSKKSHLKRGTGKDSQLLLVPQPSNSPNDPLVSFI